MKSKLIIFLVLISLFSGGCGGILALVPAVISAVVDAIPIVEQIAQYVDDHFAANPSDQGRDAIKDQLQLVRRDLSALSRAAANDEATAAELRTALDSFKSDYSKLLTLTGPIGIRSTSSSESFSMYRGAAGELIVPIPSAFALKVR